MTPVIIGNATLYQGDCREVLPLIRHVDALVTDPPYGIDIDYGTYKDSPESLTELIGVLFETFTTIAPVVALTPGVSNIYKWPEPTWVLAWVPDNSPSGGSKWGFPCWQPILVYGKDPYLARCLGRRSDVIRTAPSGAELSELKTFGHPCPKPIGFLRKLIPRVSPAPDEIILDPFMGSGTAGVAAVDLGRKFIGIEIEPKYFDIACARIEAAYAQGRLFA